MLIKDLSLELDAKALTAVRGGATDSGNSIVSGISQGLLLNAPNIVGTGAGSSLTNSNNVDASQYATQYNQQNNGDVFSLFAGVRIPFGGPVMF